MEAPKILPPSLRQQKRYIVFEAVSEEPIVYGELVSAVWNSVLSLLGELGASRSHVWFIHNLYDAKAQKGVIRCSHDTVEQVRVGLSLIQVIGETKCVVKIMGVTGTIRSARAKYFTAKDLTSFVE